MLRKLINIFKNDNKNRYQKNKIPNSAIREYVISTDIEEAEKLGITLAEYQSKRYGYSKSTQPFEHFCLPYIKNKDAVLEIGPGAGYLAHYLLNNHKNIEYYLFEPSNELCDYLKKYLMPHDARVHFMSCDGTGDLSGTENESMDVIMGFGVFVSVYHQYTFRYFQEVGNKLKKGGYFMFNFHNMDNASNEFMKEMDVFLSWGREMLSLNYIKEYLRRYEMEIVLEKFIPTHSTYVVFQKKL